MKLSLHNDTIWITFHNGPTIAVNDPSDLSPEHQGGKLPDGMTEDEIHTLVDKIHSLRSNGLAGSGKAAKAVSVFNALAVTIAIFWLGASTMVQTTTGADASASVTAGPSDQCTGSRLAQKIDPNAEHMAAIEDNLNKLKALENRTVREAAEPAKADFPFGHSQ